MQIRSIYRGARISAFKAREVTREIQGLSVAAALDVITFSAKKAATLVAKTLKSAIANAENNANLRPEKLVVQEATVGEGPTMKRFQPKARGSAGPIRKRSSNIRIILSDEIELKQRSPKKGGAKKKSEKRRSGESARAQSEAKEPAKAGTGRKRKSSEPAAGSETKTEE